MRFQSRALHTRLAHTKPARKPPPVACFHFRDESRALNFAERTPNLKVAKKIRKRKKDWSLEAFTPSQTDLIDVKRLTANSDSSVLYHELASLAQKYDQLTEEHKALKKQVAEIERSESSKFKGGWYRVGPKDEADDDHWLSEDEKEGSRDGDIDDGDDGDDDYGPMGHAHGNSARGGGCF
mmetsp:Transcript_3271/g.7573  ORF Transcript_3271/g.7573 Transcript_3271/m.7573 type:complete len:181 (+) Transcript_3271:194-736(+)